MWAVLMVAAFLAVIARLSVLHDFTDDADSLRARIEKAVLARPLQTETDLDRSVIEAEQLVAMFKGDRELEALMAEMVRNQLEIDRLANAGAPRPGLVTDRRAGPDHRPVRNPGRAAEEARGSSELVP